VQSTNVEYIQFTEASIEQQLYDIGQRIERIHLDFEKPILSPSSRTTYIPSKHAAENVLFEVEYGLGSGMDPINRATTLFQAAGTGFYSKEYGRSQMPGMREGGLEEGRIEREQTRTVVWQRLYSESPLETVAMAEQLQEEGKTLVEILKFLTEQGYQIGAPMQPSAAPGPEAVRTPEEQALQLEKGGVPGQTPGLGDLTPEELQYLQMQMQSGQSAAALAAPPARTQVFTGTNQ
jgi:hypothetical protein